MLGIKQCNTRTDVFTTIAIALIVALVGQGTSAHGQSKSSHGHAQKRVEPPVFEIGPIAGLTTEWHLTPAETAIPLGTVVFFRQPTPQNANVTWQGAIEFKRDADSSTAICPLVNTGQVVVQAVVSVPSGVGDQGPIFLNSSTSRAVLNVMDVAVDQITVLPLDVYADPVEIDESLPQDELNNQTMSYFFPISKSIAQLTQVGPNQYRTSVARELTFTAQTKPAGFESLMEWRRDGEAFGFGRTVVHKTVATPGTFTFTVGPDSQPETIEIDTYSVTVTSHTSFVDVIPQGEPVTFTAVTNPPGYESEITWLSSTKYGAGSPVLGNGPSFTTQFNNTVGPDGFQWLGVRADNSAFVQDQMLGACCLEDGRCIETSELLCMSIPGEYLGVDTKCDPTGACCKEDGSCVVTTQECCDNVNGDYQGDDTDCDPTGACCKEDGSCVVTTEECCDNVNGEYQGDGTDCDPRNPCATCQPTSPFTPVSCGGPVDCPAVALPFSQGTASTEFNPNKLCITGAGGLNISGRSLGAVLTSLPNSTEMTIFTTAPAMDVVSGGVVTSIPVPGTSIFCAGADCKISGDVALATAFAVTDTHINALSALALSSFPLPTGTIPVSAAGIGTCGGGNVNFQLCVETTGPTIECVLGGVQSSFPIPAPIVAPPLSWTNGPTAGVLVFTNTTAIRISGGVQTTFALPGNFTGFIPAAGGVTVMTTGGNLFVGLANGVTIVPFAQCDTPGGGSIAMNIAPCSSSIAAVSAGWMPAGVCCTPSEIQTVQGGPFGLCTGP